MWGEVLKSSTSADHAELKTFTEGGEKAVQDPIIENFARHSGSPAD